MMRIVTFLLGLSGAALSISMGLVTHLMFGQTILFSIGTAIVSLILILQLHLLNRNRDLIRQSELDFQDLSQHIAELESRIQATDQRLQVTEVRSDQLQEKMSQWADQEARADIVELGALVSRMVDTIGALERQGQLHRRLLLKPARPPAKLLSTTHDVTDSAAPSAEGFHSQILDSELPLLADESAAPIVPDVDHKQDHMMARALADLRQALNQHALIYDTRPAHYLAASGLAAEVQVSRLDLQNTESANLSLELGCQIAIEHGLLPAIDLLALNHACTQFAQTNRGAIEATQNPMRLIPLCTQLITDARFADTFEQTLEAHRDRAEHILLEFPAQLMSMRYMGSLSNEAALAFKAKLTRFCRWGYHLGLRTEGELGTSLPLGEIAACGFTYLRIPAGPLLAAYDAVRSGQKVTLDLHPSDYSGLMDRNGLTIIADDVQDEFAILKLTQLGIQIGMGTGLKDGRPTQPQFGAERAAE